VAQDRGREIHDLTRFTRDLAGTTPGLTAGRFRLRDKRQDRFRKIFRISQTQHLTIGIMYTTLLASLTREVAMLVGDILRKKTPRVVTVRMNETVGIAAKLMRANNISALVVKDVVRSEGNTAVGMFTERDVVRAVAEHGAAAVNVKVSQLVSVQQLVSCTSGDTIEHVRHLMNRHHIRHLPVIDNYSLVSVISMRDIAAAVDEAANSTPRAA
jgi:CBS domain-containing protein